MRWLDGRRTSWGSIARDPPLIGTESVTLDQRTQAARKSADSPIRAIAFLPRNAATTSTTSSSRLFIMLNPRVDRTPIRLLRGQFYSQRQPGSCNVSRRKGKLARPQTEPDSQQSRYVQPASRCRAPPSSDPV